MKGKFLTLSTDSLRTIFKMLARIIALKNKDEMTVQKKNWTLQIVDFILRIAGEKGFESCVGKLLTMHEQVILACGLKIGKFKVDLNRKYGIGSKSKVKGGSGKGNFPFTQFSVDNPRVGGVFQNLSLKKYR